MNRFFAITITIVMLYSCDIQTKTTDMPDLQFDSNYHLNSIFIYGVLKKFIWVGTISIIVICISIIPHFCHFIHNLFGVILIVPNWSYG
jgi:hypothetical protein